MNLYQYLVRLETVLHARRDIKIELFQVDVTTVGARLKGELRFSDGSRLSFSEQLEQTGRRDFRRLSHRLNYLNKDSQFIFRYENSPHYPHLPTFPAHKHVGDSAVEAEPPDLSDVLAEIDAIIYRDSGADGPQ